MTSEGDYSSTAACGGIPPFGSVTKVTFGDRLRSSQQLSWKESRGVAQPGSAPALGAE
jgi:hypothetical protein